MNSFSRIRFEFKDDYEHIRVIDTYPENHRSLHFEDSIQGVLDLSAHHEPVLEYVALMTLGARFFQTLPKNVLLGGLGSCSLLHALDFLWHRNAKIQTVELSAQVLSLARRFFRLRSRNQVFLGDLRAVLEEGEIGERYDLIMVDCYSAVTIPPHLTTIEFMELLHQRLDDEGACIFNLWSPACNELCGDQLRTMLEVFGRVGTISCREDQNLIAYVRKDPKGAWPGHLNWKNKRYDLRSIGLSDRQLPEFMEESDIITDDTISDFFQAVGMEF